MKQELLVIFITVFYSSIFYSQHSGNSGTGSGEFQVETVSDKEPVVKKIKQSIENDLITRGFSVSGFDLYKTPHGYQTMIPIKKDGNLLLIWADYLYKENGEWLKTSIKLSEGECEPENGQFCKLTQNLKEAYFKHFNTYPENIILYFETPEEKPFFKIIHDGHWTTFDKDGNFIE